MRILFTYPLAEMLDFKFSLPVLMVWVGRDGMVVIKLQIELLIVLNVELS